MSAPKIIPEQFAVQGSTIASYDYTDIAEGTGVRIFYGSVVKYTPNQGNATTGGELTKYILTRTLPYSSLIVDSKSQTTPVGHTGDMTATDASWTFDLAAFNTPQTVKGTALVQQSLCPLAVGGTAGNTLCVRMRYLIQKYDGSTATTIGSAWSVRSAQVGTGAFSSANVMTISVPITLTETHFQIGNILRLVCEVWSTNDANDRLASVLIGTDPLNRDDPNSVIVPSTDVDVTTQLQFHCPFRIEGVS